MDLSPADFLVQQVGQCNIEKMQAERERSVSGAENGAERPENRVERSGAERSGERAWEKNDGAEREVAERREGGCEAGTKRGAG